MPTLLIRFPARRYHATPWGHHVNEGLIEWPPSPWRLLRALLAVGYATGVWTGDGPPPVARSLIEKLSDTLPVYHLPKAAGAHSRHYMPLARFKKGTREDTTLVFDTWAQVEDEVLCVTWNVMLSAPESSLLEVLSERLGYLGRSESWVEARVLQPAEILPEIDTCTPSNAPPPPGWEQIALIAPQTKGDYTEWRRIRAESIFLELPGAKTPDKKILKKLLSQREKALEPYPPDLISCLQVETSWLRKHGWSQPPGSKRVFYHRSCTALEAGAPKPTSIKAIAQPVQTVLLSMTTQSGNDHALPPVARTLPQAELLHRALTSFATRNGDTHPALTGCDELKRPLKGPHDHAHILPIDLDGDGHLDHVLIWAPGGLDGSAQRAIRAVRRTHTKGGIEPLRLALVGAGSTDDLRLLPDEYGRRLGVVFGPEEGAWKWRSLTPFVAPRYLKKNGNNALAGQVASELASRGLPTPVEVRVLETGDHPEFLRHRHFIRKRRSGPQPPADFGYSLEIRFDEPVFGPMCLGYGSHFGLGLFSSTDYK